MAAMPPMQPHFAWAGTANHPAANHAQTQHNVNHSAGRIETLARTAAASANSQTAMARKVAGENQASSRSPRSLSAPSVANWNAIPRRNA